MTPRLWILLLAGVYIAGCAPAIVVEEPTEPSAYPHHTADEVIEAIRSVDAADNLVAYTSSGAIELRSPAQNASGTVILRHRAADTLWASVRGPLNIEVVRALVTPEAFQLHDRLQNRLYTGPAAAAQQLFPGAVGPDDVFRAVTGTVVPDPGVRWFINPSTLDGAAIYWLTAPDGRIRIAVDPLHWRVRRYERLNALGEVIDRRRFAGFGNVEGRVLPMRVELSNPAEETFVTIEHRRLELNPPSLAFPFDPRGAEVIPIDAP